jgi:hypothetical protein
MKKYVGIAAVIFASVPAVQADTPKSPFADVKAVVESTGQTKPVTVAWLRGCENPIFASQQPMLCN